MKIPKDIVLQIASRSNEDLSIFGKDENSGARMTIDFKMSLLEKH